MWNRRIIWKSCQHGAQPLTWQVCSVCKRFPLLCTLKHTNTAACSRPPPNPFPWKLLPLVSVWVGEVDSGYTGLHFSSTAEWLHWVFIVNDKMLWFSKIIFQQFPKSMCFFTYFLWSLLAPPHHTHNRSYTVIHFRLTLFPLLSAASPFMCSHSSLPLKHSMSYHMFPVGILTWP